MKMESFFIIKKVTIKESYKFFTEYEPVNKKYFRKNRLFFQ